jgi:pimeloyl-ACP methyl ester carboxylesterase
VVDDRPKAVISILGGGSLAQIIWDGYELGRSKRQLQQAGVTEEQFERAWALMGPANWQPKVNPDRVLLLSGLYDPIVTPENTRRLWRAWGELRLHWFPAGHASVAVYNRQIKKELFEFLSTRL